MVICWCSIVIAPPLLLLRWWSSSIVVWVVILLWNILTVVLVLCSSSFFSHAHLLYDGSDLLGLRLGLGLRGQFELENLRKEFNKINKEVSKLKHLIKESEETKKSIADKEVEVGETLSLLNSKLETIGNLIHDFVPISNDEANNVVVRSWGEKRVEPKLKNHVDLVELLEIADTNKGDDVAGGRGFYLKGDGVRLNQALINFGLDFLDKRQYTLVHTTPFFMTKNIMSNCAQLAQFDEELYKGIAFPIYMRRLFGKGGSSEQWEG
ncbi:hypothetical protein Fmac_005366 [Flemingia macrophylla]|uniref:Serine--tRNA ligase n=1 Tax=Flemingia macrophylla TaxID=520843 RepID=A0ABD1N7J9_9FABA